MLSLQSQTWWFQGIFSQTMKSSMSLIKLKLKLIIQFLISHVFAL